jgi:hypothetical protein
LLLDQAFLAGLGNYLRVEILWQVGLSGRHNASALDDKQLDALAHALLDIPRCRIVPAVGWMRISITARCSALRFSIAMAKFASAAAGLSRKRCSRRGRFTGVRDASVSDTLLALLDSVPVWHAPDPAHGIYRLG